MNFNNLVSLFKEAKGTKPGERFFNAKNSTGPSGISSSPVGKDNFNPELPEKRDSGPKDEGMNDVVSIIGLLSKGLQLLKNDDVFEDQMRGIMNGFQKNRNQISAYQESVLKTKPKIIDNQYGNINRLTKIVNNPEMRDRPDWNKYYEELQQAVADKNKNEEILNDVYDAIDGVTEKNEELNNEYLEQLLTAVKHTTKRLYQQLTDMIQEENPEQPKQIIPLHELDWDKLQKQLSKNAQAQLQLLEMLMSDKDNNPLTKFLELQEKNYNEARDRYYQLKRGDNYSITTDQLYQNLPLFSFVRFLSNAVLKSPKIPLTTKQQNIAKGVASDGGGMLDKLGNIVNERQFEELRPELLSYIDQLEIDDFQKDALRTLANGKFRARKNAPTAPFKIRSALKTAQITESFDDATKRLLSNLTVDNDDFKLDLIEVLY